MVSIIKKIKSNPHYVVLALNEHELLNWIPDSLMIKRLFRIHMGYRLDLDNTKTFNEKLQWLKLYDRQPEYINMVDKYAVREYVEEQIGRQYLIPLLGVWENVEDIDFDSLPNEFVIKCNHDSGSVVFCRDKTQFDEKKAKQKLKKHMHKSGYIHGREWPYKNVTRKIIAEQLLVDESGNDLKDYKVLCFNGEPKLIELHKHRYSSNQTQDFYDTNWNKTTISQSGLEAYKADNDIAPRPETLDEMLKLSRILSKDIPHVRVDWYSVYNRLYFGELTFFDGSGFDPFDDVNDDYMIGEWITLPKKKRR